MFCHKCGKRIADDAIFCSYCGVSIHSEEEIEKLLLVCPKCNQEFGEDQVFCDKCGSKLNLQPARKAENPVPPTQNGQRKPKPNLLASVLFGLGICVCLVVLFLILWSMGIIDW